MNKEVQCKAIFTVSHFQFSFFLVLPWTQELLGVHVEAIHDHFRNYMSPLVDQILLEDFVLISVTEVWK